MHGKVGRIIWNQSRYSSEKPPMPARLSNENLQVEGTFSDTSGPTKGTRHLRWKKLYAQSAEGRWRGNCPSSDKIMNKDLLDSCCLKQLSVVVKRRRWRRLGHLFRMMADGHSGVEF